MKPDPGQKVLTEVVYHYLDVTNRPVLPGVLRGLADSLGSKYRGRPLLELLGRDSRFVNLGGHWGLNKWRRFTVLDVETTGLSPRSNRVTEVALIQLWGTRDIARWSSLVNPGCAIPSYISRLTGISDGLVADAPPFAELADAIAEIVGDSVLVAHNAPFDRGFLCAEFRRAGRTPLANYWLDTVSMARRLLPHLPNCKLGTVARCLDIPAGNRHRAMPDAVITARVFGKLAGLLGEGQQVADFLPSS